MRSAILAFAGGILGVQFLASLPAAGGLVLLAGAGVGLFAAVRGRAGGRGWALLAVALLGFAWAGLFAHLRLADELPVALEGRDIEVRGVVAELPQRFENGVRFRFEVEEASARVPKHVSLAWYRGFRGDDEAMAAALPAPRAGERWRLTVRLKRPHGNLNPHGFDYEAWLLEQGVRATGYVRPAPDNVRLDALAGRPDYLVERLRETIRDRFRQTLGDARHAGILVALAIGDQRAIDPELWQAFARTGTTHLMSISGLHVTMLAGLAWALVNFLWRRSATLPLHLPAQKAAALAGFVAAFGYCLLAGFAVPAQRTLYMLGVVALALWTGRAASGSRVLALALLLVLLLDPWAVLAAGFWLSFGAVALLFYVGAGRLGRSHWLAEWAWAQWAITLGMIPALLALFQQFSLSSPLANALAIPLVSLVVTPLALAGALPFGDALLHLALWLTDWMMLGLVWLSALPLSVWQQHAPAAWTVALALVGLAWALLPRGVPLRWLGLFAALPMLLVPAPRPATGVARITVLDVGQGLAAHVQTAGHDLLYDTGPAFSPDANSGNRIIVPYLRAVGARRLDMLVVTHTDKDHSGGAESVLDAVPTAALVDSLPGEHPFAALPVAHRDCADTEAWEWDGVRFEFLHPPPELYKAPAVRGNDLSCVLKVTAGGRAMLLTSDIEAVSERALVERKGDNLRADVLLVPHHGSRTSSTPEFIAAVGAQTAVVPVGYRNRFGHPKPEVVERYAGMRLLRTDRDGAVSVDLGAQGVAVTVERERRRRYWHARE